MSIGEKLEVTPSPSLAFENEMRLKLLRLFLLSAAFGWGISVYGVFAPWHSALAQLQGMGAGDIPHDPMLDYWLRMTAGAFTGIGIFFLILAANPKSFTSIIAFIGPLLVGEGLILLFYGLKLKLEPLPFYVDVIFCLFTGIGIWSLRHAAKEISNKSQEPRDGK